DISRGRPDFQRENSDRKALTRAARYLVWLIRLPPIESRFILSKCCDSPMPYRQTENVTRKLAARHTAILTAAREAAAEGGMAAVQSARAADRAGIAPGTVYRFFPAKTELVAELVRALAEQEVAALAQAARAAPGPLSALAAAIASFAARALIQ